jgi:hypothetical protein
MKNFTEALIKEYISSDTTLTEKWYAGDNVAFERLWHSDSISQFRSFLQNAGQSGIRGLRLSIAPDCYLAARASDLNHDGIVYLANSLYLTDLRQKDFEWSTVGYPKVDDFEIDNFEGMDDLEADEDAEYSDDLEVSSIEVPEEDLEDEDETEDEISDEQRFNDYYADQLRAADTSYDYKDFRSIFQEDATSDIRGRLVANCGTFEVSLYNFKSEQVPESLKAERAKYAKTLESSETWEVLKPLCKKLYFEKYK